MNDIAIIEREVDLISAPASVALRVFTEPNAAEAKAKREAQEKAEREAAEIAKREADNAHRGAIHRDAVSALVAEGIDDDTAKKIVTLIAQQKVPNVIIRY